MLWKSSDNKTTLWTLPALHKLSDICLGANQTWFSSSAINNREQAVDAFLQVVEHKHLSSAGLKRKVLPRVILFFCWENATPFS